MSWRAAVLGGCLLAVMGAPALAQERGGPGRGRCRGFGPGGPGGPGGMPCSSVLLLGMPEVRQEIALSDAQQKPTGDLLAEAQQEMQAAFANINFQELQSLSDEEREQRFAEVRKKSAEAA